MLPMRMPRKRQTWATCNSRMATVRRPKTEGPLRYRLEAWAIHQAPNQIPMPWTMAIGKNNAPAIRKPHLSSEKQVMTCVSHAANDAMKRIIAISPSPFIFFKLFISRFSFLHITLQAPAAKPRSGFGVRVAWLVRSHDRAAKEDQLLPSRSLRLPSWDSRLSRWEQFPGR